MDTLMFLQIWLSFMRSFKKKIHIHLYKKKNYLIVTKKKILSFKSFCYHDHNMNVINPLSEFPCLHFPVSVRIVGAGVSGATSQWWGVVQTRGSVTNHEIIVKQTWTISTCGYTMIPVFTKVFISGKNNF